MRGNNTTNCSIFRQGNTIYWFVAVIHRLVDVKFMIMYKIDNDDIGPYVLD